MNAMFPQLSFALTARKNARITKLTSAATTAGAMVTIAETTDAARSQMNAMFPQLSFALTETKNARITKLTSAATTAGVTVTIAETTDAALPQMNAIAQIHWHVRQVIAWILQFS